VETRKPQRHGKIKTGSNLKIQRVRKFNNNVVMKNLFILIFVLLANIYTSGQTFKKGDTWVGSYQCSGNKLEFKLSIDEVQNDIVRSRFIFLGGDGVFEMIGKYSSNEFTFTGTNWINNPNQSYVTIGLHGFYLNSPDRLIGNTISKLTFTEGNECTGFYLERK
jgi:hypothetical protein